MKIQRAHNCILVEGEGKETFETVTGIHACVARCGWGCLGRALYLVADLSMVVAD